MLKCLQKKQLLNPRAGIVHKAPYGAFLRFKGCTGSAPVACREPHEAAPVACILPFYYCSGGFRAGLTPD